MIAEAILESKRKKISSYPVHSNRASDLGNPCVRYHVYNRTRWAEKTLHNASLQSIFDLGNDFEQIALRELAEAGIRIIEQQRSFEWKDYQITGHVDGLVQVNGGAYPIEIKSMSPFVFDSIQDITSLTKGKYAYLRRYPTQLNLYMLMKGIDKAVFLFKNKSTGAYKEVWMDLDYQLGEETLQRAEAINAHVKAGTLPDRIADDGACEDCPFVHICIPDRTGQEVEILDDGELVELLTRHEELKETVKEYNEIDGTLKKKLEGRDKLMVGPYFITGKWIEKKEFLMKASRYWQRKVARP
jgi:CRISPR/Cas system-associated exonuclease Cas4 (RecB family)